MRGQFRGSRNSPVELATVRLCGPLILSIKTEKTLSSLRHFSSGWTRFVRRNGQSNQTTGVGLERSTLSLFGRARSG
jgi:hypothetical protein